MVVVGLTEEQETEAVDKSTLELPGRQNDLVRAVARGEVDLAIVWGPFAGYFGTREGVPMRLRRVTPAEDPPGLRFTFSIAAGVRPGDTALRAQLDGAMARRRPDIERVLRQYGVPLLGDSPQGDAHPRVSLRVPASRCRSSASKEEPCDG